MAFRRRLMYSRRGRRRWRRCLMHYWRWRRSLLMGRRRWRWRVHVMLRRPLRSRGKRLRWRIVLPFCLRRRWRVHVVLRRPLRSRGERLRRRIVLPFSLCRRWRTVIIGAPYRLGRRLVIITPTIEVASTVASVTSWLLVDYFRIAVA